MLLLLGSTVMHKLNNIIGATPITRARKSEKLAVPMYTYVAIVHVFIIQYAYARAHIEIR